MQLLTLFTFGLVAVRSDRSRRAGQYRPLGTMSAYPRPSTGLPHLGLSAGQLILGLSAGLPHIGLSVDLSQLGLSLGLSRLGLYVGLSHLGLSVGMPRQGLFAGQLH